MHRYAHLRPHPACLPMHQRLLMLLLMLLLLLLLTLTFVVFLAFISTRIFSTLAENS